MARPELVSNVLQKSLDKMGLLPRAKRFQVFCSWRRMVGDIARNAKPRRLDGDVLYVATSSSAWAQELTLMRRGIISRINENLGGNYINDIRFSEHLWGTTDSFYDLDIYRSPDKEYKKFMSQDVLTQAEKQRIASLGSPGEDSRLSFTFQRFAATMEKRAKYLVKKGFRKCNTCGYLHQPERGCPYCQAKKEFYDYNRIITILEKHPETSDLTLSVMTGVKEKEILVKARQALDSRWYQTVRHVYFTAATRNLARHEQDQLHKSMVKLVSLRTGQPEYQVTQEDLDKALGKRFSALLKRRAGRR